MSTWRGQRAKERTRSRIVVSVDDERPAGRKRHRGGDPDRTQHARRRMSRRRRGAMVVVASVAAFALAAAATAFYLWYQSGKRLPTYSLALLVDASRRNDRQEVDQLVDVDQVARSLVPQVIDRVTGRAPQQANAAGQQAGATGQQTNAAAQAPAAVRRYVEANAGVLVPGARDAVRDALVESIKQGVAGRAAGYPFFVTASAARFAPDGVEVQGDAATVSFKSNGRPVALTMQRAGGGERWRVVAVQSDELASRIADNLARGLPALGR